MVFEPPLTLRTVQKEQQSTYNPIIVYIGVPVKGLDQVSTSFTPKIQDRLATDVSTNHCWARPGGNDRVVTHRCGPPQVRNT